MTPLGSPRIVHSSPVWAPSYPKARLFGQGTGFRGLWLSALQGCAVEGCLRLRVELSSDLHLLGETRAARLELLSLATVLYLISL